MLLEFSLSNDGCFADQQTFTLIASSLKDVEAGRVVQLKAPAELRVLTAAMILGKNGSGKSTLVTALEFLRKFVRTSSDVGRYSEGIPYTPCLIEKELKYAPTEYRIVFSAFDVTYQFSFSYNEERILSESLQIADKTSRFRKLYEREFSAVTKEYVYSYGEALKGNKTVWQESTKEKSLFLSTAVSLNSKSLKPAFDWIVYFLRPINSGILGFEGLTASKCLDDGEFKSKILSFMQKLDINIHDINVEEKELEERFIRENYPAMLDKFLEDKNYRKGYEVDLVHRDCEGDLYSLPLAQESTGTQAIFSLCGPLFDTLDNGYCIVIDEVNTNLHPLVLKALVEAFSDESLNKRRAQLVFTSHDVSLLREHEFRRDQVWVIESDECGRAHLTSFSDFSIRKGEALDKGYLAGRYGGVPYIRNVRNLVTN